MGNPGLSGLGPSGNDELLTELQTTEGENRFGGERLRVCWRMVKCEESGTWLEIWIWSVESVLSQKPRDMEGVSGGDWPDADSLFPLPSRGPLRTRLPASLTVEGPRGRVLANGTRVKP